MAIVSNKPELAEIDTSDVRWKPEVGDRTKRSLIKFLQRLILKAPGECESATSENGFEDQDQQVDTDAIEAQAWELAGEVIWRARDRISEYEIDLWASETAQEAFERVLEEVIGDIEDEYLKPKN